MNERVYHGKYSDYKAGERRLRGAKHRNGVSYAMFRPVRWWGRGAWRPIPLKRQFA